MEIKIKKTIDIKFSVEDFEGSGQYLMRTKYLPEAYEREGTKLSACSNLFKVCWRLGKDRVWYLAAMSDGMICSPEFKSKEELVEYLNRTNSNNNISVQWRPATRKEIHMAIDEQPSKYLEKIG